MLLPEQTPDTARIAGRRLREAIEALSLPHPADPPGGVITVSVGVSAFAVEPTDTGYGALLARTERALLTARAGGGNQVVVGDGAAS